MENALPRRGLTSTTGLTTFEATAEATGLSSTTGVTSPFHSDTSGANANDSAITEAILFSTWTDLATSELTVEASSLTATSTGTLRTTGSRPEARTIIVTISH